ncbi:MAG: FHA domain-containing protein [Verrucomicrobia bacterium]|nr:FHA domain-containing protein [Verrucomicrobiota bacterium]
MDKLSFTNGPLAGATAELIGEEITIGRSPENGICVDDASVAERHAAIVRKNRECVLRDLGSGLGTRIRGEKVIVATLQDGDKVAFGSVEAQFETTEIKLTLPVPSVAPAAVGTPMWPQRHAARASSAGSAFKTAALRLVQVVVLAAVAGGAYWAYQKLSNVDPFGDAPPASSAKATPLATPRETVTASLPPAPQPTPAAPATPPAAPTQPAPPASAAPAAAAAPAPAKVASASSNPAIQQAMLLITQNKHADAITYLDKFIASATDPAVAVEAQAPLKQALDAQLAALASSKQQWEAQCKSLQERLKLAQDGLAQNTQALEQKKADEARVYATGRGYWFNGRWVYNTRKGTGDGTTAIHDMQIKVMTSTQEAKKLSDLLNRYQQQVLALDQQITPIQARVAQMDAVLKAAQPMAARQP